MLAKIYLGEWTEGLACIPPTDYFFLLSHNSFVLFMYRNYNASFPTLVDCPLFNEVPKQLMRERSPLMKSKI